MRTKWAWLLTALLVATALLAWPSRPTKRKRDPLLRPSAAAVVAQAARAVPPSPSTDDPAEPGDDAPEPNEMSGAEMFGDRRVESLLERLSSPDPFVVIDAADGLRARRVTAAIPKLATHDLSANPDSARTVIHAMGQLAASAGPAERKVATDRLGTWLSSERKRQGADAPGNVLQIYEALGDTSDPSAAAVLERELADPNVPLAALIEVIASLVRLHQPSSRQALLDAKARISALSFEDEFEREVQADVLGRLEAAIAVF